MNFGTLKTRVLMNAGNMSSTHPIGASVGQYVNDGVRFMIMRATQRFPNLELFPEHRDVEWTDVTIADQNYLALPIDQMVVQRAFSADSSSSPNLNNTGWRELNYIEPRAFDLLQKPTTELSYPSLYTVREGRVYFHPTPRSTKTTYIKIDGIQDEPDMSSSTDSPRTNVRWHPAIVACASYLLLTDLGWYEDAGKQLELADEHIKSETSLIGLRRSNVHKTVKVAGTPRGI